MGDLLETLLGGAGWGLGIGAALGAVSLFGRGLRPVAKQAVKLGMAAGDRVQEWTAEMREQVDDIVAEAKAEHTANGAGTPIVAPGGEPATAASRRRRAETPSEA